MARQLGGHLASHFDTAAALNNRRGKSCVLRPVVAVIGHLQLNSLIQNGLFVPKPSHEADRQHCCLSYLRALSVRVCWCPSLTLGAVTQFVTRLADLDGGDLLLRRSFRVLCSTAALVIRAGFLVVLVPLDVCGSHLARYAKGTWHAPRCELLAR